MMKGAKRVLVLDRKLLEEKNYWVAVSSAEIEPSNLHLDYHRPELYSAAIDKVKVNITGEVYDRLMQLAGDGPFLLYTTLMAALKICLHKYTGSRKIAVGSPALKNDDHQTPELNALTIIDLVDERLSFKAFLLNVRQTLLDAYAKQRYPFERLIEDLGMVEIENRCPLFDVALSMKDIHADFPAVGNDITLIFSRRSDYISGVIEYNRDLFNRGSVESFASRLIYILEEALKDVSAPIWQLSILTERERRQLVSEWNATAVNFADSNCFHQLFESVVEQRADSVALSFRENEITYRELNSRANRLARYLRKRGIGSEVTVGVCVDRSPDIVIAILAIWKAGGIYLPLDSTTPKERLSYMLSDARALVLLTQRQVAASLPEHEASLIFLDSDWDVITQEDNTNLGVVSEPNNLAYVIFTSGSTGRPKGALLEHRGVCNLSDAQVRAFGLKCDDRTLQFSSFTFDASISEIVMSLRAGAMLCLATRDSLMPGPDFVRLMEEKAVTCITIPPSVLAALPSKGLPALRLMVVAGEACPPGLIERWSAGRRFINAYGPTETTVCASAAECSTDQRLPPIGRPIANTRINILDRSLHPVPVMTPGELHISGIGVARGYLNRSDLTAERFVPNPFTDEPGTRFYKTGDLAKYLPDGNIEFIGRIDRQVKVNGYRIELGELEAILSQHPAIQDAVVMVQEDDERNKRLTAYLVLSPGSVISISEVRGHLRGKLPEYMIPSALVVVESLPLTPHGKLDRNALLAQNRARPELGERLVAPRTPLEEVVTGIWTAVLGLEEIGVNDNFFELGGNSLLATQAMSHVCDTLQVDVSLRAFFGSPTVAGLVEYVEEARQSGQSIKLPPILPAPRDRALPLSFAQQRLWFLNQLEPESPFYNVSTALRLRGRLNTAALEKSLNEIIRRHETLRTIYKTVDGQTVQVVQPLRVLKIPVIDLRRHPVDDREAEAQRMALEECRLPFNLAEGPVLRAKLLKVDEEEHIALFNMHHIVCDGWSIGILINEIVALYEHHYTGKPYSLPDLPVQYADYSVWQRQWLQGEALDAQLSYWIRHLEGSPLLLDLPTDHPRPQRQSFKGARLPVLIPQDVFEALKALTRSEAVTLFMALVTAWKVLLMRYSGQEDILVCTPIANRNRPEIEGLIGYFANTLVLRTDLSGNPTFKELLGRVREVTLDAYMRQDIPFERLVEALQPERSLSHHPIAQVVFVLQNASMPELELAGLNLTPVEVDNPTAKFDLTFNMWEAERGLLGSLEYSTDLFEAATIRQMLRHFENLLRSVSAQPESRLDTLEFLSEEERRVLEQPLDVEELSGTFSF